MKFFILLLFLTPIVGNAQKPLDKKIIVTGPDTVGLFERVRVNFVKAGYIVRDDRNVDTLTTYAKDRRPLGYVYLKAYVKRDTVIFWGYWGMRAMNAAGYTIAPTDYDPILYYKGNTGKGWKMIQKFAGKLNGKMEYSK